MTASSLVFVAVLAAVSIGAFTPQESHEERTIEGFKVLVAKSLLSTEADQTALALRELDDQLYRTARAVPAAALERLRRVPIWISKDSKTACAAYHPSREWLEAHEGHDPRMAGAVEIGSIHNFLSWTHQQPFMVLHELAHAYHHQVLGYDHAGILAAFARAKADPRWSTVLRNDGAHEKHYALTDAKEWFAEASEAFFGTNDFFPFVHAELHELDRESDDVLAEAWGAPRFVPRGGAGVKGK